MTATVDKISPRLPLNNNDLRRIGRNFPSSSRWSGRWSFNKSYCSAATSSLIQYPFILSTMLTSGLIDNEHQQPVQSTRSPASDLAGEDLKKTMSVIHVRTRRPCSAFRVFRVNVSSSRPSRSNEQHDASIPYSNLISPLAAGTP
jgi:hypothetical protein